MSGKEKIGDTVITRDEVVQIRQQAAKAVEEWSSLSQELENGNQRLSAVNDRIDQIEMLRKALSYSQGSGQREWELQKNVASSAAEYGQLQAESVSLTKRLPEAYAQIQAIPAKRMQSAWQALEAELRLASQGAGDLMGHPGYTGFSPSYFFPEPSLLDDVTPEIQQLAEAHETALRSYESYFSDAISSADKQIEGLQAEMATIAELEGQSVKIRKQRQLAIAGGNDLTSIDKSLADLETQLGNKRCSVVQVEDEIAGLKLRREELAKALAQAQKGLQAVGSCLAAMNICFIAQEYNRHAALAADFFKKFHEGVKNLKDVGGAGARLPETCFGASTIIPRIRLHWGNMKAIRDLKGASTDEKYFCHNKVII